MDPCMYIIMPAPHVTPMSPGKLASQAAHAAVEAYRLSNKDKQVVNRWQCGGHYKKVVLMTDDLRNAAAYITDRGFGAVLIQDEGHTEFSADLTPTAIGVEIVDKDLLHVQETFGAFKLYRGAPTVVALPTSTTLAELNEFYRQLDLDRLTLARYQTQSLRAEALRSEQVVEQARKRVGYKTGRPAARPSKIWTRKTEPPAPGLRPSGPPPARLQWGRLKPRRVIHRW